MSKIFLIVNDPHAIMNFRFDLINALISRGHEVHVGAPLRKSDKNLLSQLNARGVFVHKIIMARRGQNPIVDILTFLNLVFISLKIKPDSVIAYTIKPIFYGMFASRLTKVPKPVSVITGLSYFMDGDTENSYFKSIVSKLYQKALNCASVVFCYNDDDFNLVKKCTDRPLIHKINGSGVNLARYPYTLLPPLSSGIKFLMMSRLLRSKGIVEYVSAAKKLRSKYPNTKFFLSGWFEKGIDNDKITEAEWEKLNDGNCVEYLGYNNDVTKIIDDIHVYTLPSYREGLPRSVMECMAMGRPIIVSDAPGCREVIVHGQNGFIVKKKSVDDLVSAMERFILNPELIPSMALISRDMAVEKYDVDKINEHIISILNL